MKELVVISGKGGTGKTSIVGAFAALADKKVLADCDVDAADLHLLLEPRILQREAFKAGRTARIDSESCTGCGKCEELCAFDAVHVDGCGGESGSKAYRVDPVSCEGCGVCVHFCPAECIAFPEATSGEWFISRTRHGPMVHAKLGIAEENSGKLVTLVRNQARQIAERDHLELVIVDGPPGIGCPVIASVTGADLVLVVTEPTLSGLHDLERVRELTGHFGIPTAVCINKHDLNSDLTAEIQARTEALDARVLGKVRYDPAVTKAQIMKASVVEYTGGAVTEDVKDLWRNVTRELG